MQRRLRCLFQQAIYGLTVSVSDHLFACLVVYVPVCLRVTVSHVRLSVCLSTGLLSLSVYWPVLLPVCLFACLSVLFSPCLSVRLSVILFFSLSPCLSVFLPACSSPCLSFVCLPVCSFPCFSISSHLPLSTSLFSHPSLCLSVYLSTSLPVTTSPPIPPSVYPSTSPSCRLSANRSPICPSISLSHHPSTSNYVVRLEEELHRHATNADMTARRTFSICKDWYMP